MFLTSPYIDQAITLMTCSPNSPLAVDALRTRTCPHSSDACGRRSWRSLTEIKTSKGHQWQALRPYSRQLP